MEAISRIVRWVVPSLIIGISTTATAQMPTVLYKNVSQVQREVTEHVAKRYAPTDASHEAIFKSYISEAFKIYWNTPKVQLPYDETSTDNLKAQYDSLKQRQRDLDKALADSTKVQRELEKQLNQSQMALDKTLDNARSVSQKVKESQQHKLDSLVAVKTGDHQIIQALQDSILLMNDLVTQLKDTIDLQQQALMQQESSLAKLDEELTAAQQVNRIIENRIRDIDSLDDQLNQALHLIAHTPKLSALDTIPLSTVIATYQGKKGMVDSLTPDRSEALHQKADSITAYICFYIALHKAVAQMGQLYDSRLNAVCQQDIENCYNAYKPLTEGQNQDYNAIVQALSNQEIAQESIYALLTDLENAYCISDETELRKLNISSKIEKYIGSGGKVSPYYIRMNSALEKLQSELSEGPNRIQNFSEINTEQGWKEYLNHIKTEF